MWIELGKIFYIKWIKPSSTTKTPNHAEPYVIKTGQDGTERTKMGQNGQKRTKNGQKLTETDKNRQYWQKCTRNAMKS